MSDQLMQIYLECSKAIAQGQLTLADCLAQYPEHATELQTLLEIDVSLQNQRSVMLPTPIAESRKRLLAKLPDRVPQTKPVEPSQSWFVSIWNELFSGNNLSEKFFVTTAVAIAGLAILCLASLTIPALLTGDSEQMASGSNNETLLHENSVSEEQVDSTDNNSDIQIDTAQAVSEELEESANIIFIPALGHPLEIGPDVARLDVLSGVVEVQVKGKWAVAGPQANVRASDQIRTGRFSTAKITFHDGSQVTLAPNSELRLDEVDANRPENGFRTVVMTQLAGQSEHQVDFRNDFSSRYEIFTPDGASGRARGTTFTVNVNKNGQNHFQVEEGRVQVSNANVSQAVTDGQIAFTSPNEPPTQPYFIIVGHGEITEQGDSWVIGGQTFLVNESTIIVGDPRLGDVASVVGYLHPDGSFVAIHITVIHSTPANQFRLVGIVNSIGATSWDIDGQTINIDENTDIEEGIEVGDRVEVNGIVDASGELLAREIRLASEELTFEFTGIVEAIDAAVWNISGISIQIDENTGVEDGIELGDVVHVEGVITETGQWLATEISLLDDGESAFELIGEVDAIEPWAVASREITVDEFTRIDEGIEIGDLVEVTGRILPDGSWLASEIRLIEGDDDIFSFVGIVDSIDPWQIGGLDIEVDDETEIDDDIEVGSLARVSGVVLDDGTLLATEIENLNDDGQQTGCFTITTTVISVGSGQLNLQGLAPIPVNGAELPQNLVSSSTITITICINDDGTITIITIIVIILPPPPTTGGGGNGNSNGNGGGDKVTICHNGKNTLTISVNAVQAHLDHGDSLGPCDGDDDDDD